MKNINKCPKCNSILIPVHSLKSHTTKYECKSCAIYILDDEKIGNVSYEEKIIYTKELNLYKIFKK